MGVPRLKELEDLVLFHSAEAAALVAADGAGSVPASHRTIVAFVTEPNDFSVAWCDSVGVIRAIVRDRSVAKVVQSHSELLKPRVAGCEH
jgi:hypothetical protein